jgi:NAD(P)-dependent dehydrogenase (short-subunit alcohol dehydrogenase family)
MQRSSVNSWTMVTGATGGIGKALIARLATRGHDVIATARKPERIHIARGPGRVVAIHLDMERPETMTTAAGDVARIVGDGQLSALVNMAGIIIEGPLETIPPAELRRQFEINVVGPFALTQAVLPMLKQARGRVVNIGAISAHLTVPFYGPIAASKSALASLNDAMRLEFAQHAVDVILIEPGAMKTEIFSTSRATRDANLRAFPEQERRYRPALTEMDRAFEKAGADDPEVVVDAVIKAVLAKHPKPRVIVGKGTGALLMLSRLPIRTRDKLVKSALGLTNALKPAS